MKNIYSRHMKFHTVLLKIKKSFATGGDLILPAATKMIEILHGSKYGDDIRKIFLSNNTVVNRISDINKDQLFLKLTSN